MDAPVAVAAVRSASIPFCCMCPGRAATYCQAARHTCVQYARQSAPIKQNVHLLNNSCLWSLRFFEEVTLLVDKRATLGTIFLATERALLSASPQIMNMVHQTLKGSRGNDIFPSSGVN